MPGVDVNDVKACVDRAANCLSMPAAQVGDVVEGHFSSLDRVVSKGRHWQVGWAHGSYPAKKVGAIHAVVAEFYGC